MAARIEAWWAWATSSSTARRRAPRITQPGTLASARSGLRSPPTHSAFSRSRLARLVSTSTGSHLRPSKVVRRTGATGTCSPASL
eukprot:8587031-Alexandrium_andersonii.AAC.1